MPRLIILLACGAVATFAAGVALTRGDSTGVNPPSNPFTPFFAGKVTAPADLPLLTRPGEKWDGTELAEAPGVCLGTGRYRLRSGNRVTPVALTAPHGGSDMATATIVDLLFAESDAAAAAFNSAPRSPSATCGGLAVDLTQQPDHAFTDFARAFAAQYPDGIVVQLHGFDARAQRGDADMIVSNATRQPDAPLLDLADCLTIAIAPDKVAVFPVESDALGGTGNAQAAALRDMGKSRFIHLETSAALRQRLMRDAGLRAGLNACLAENVR